MRERWEQASPEERLQMRREYKDRTRQPAPESRRDAADQWNNPPVPERDRQRGQRYRNGNAEEASFGFGFERRRHEDDRVEPPPASNMPYPGNFFDRRNSRENSRDGRRDDDRR
jgi:hypothetical protein